MKLPPYHKHIHDPTLGDSTHCICHKFDEPPPGGCGRLHCVNANRAGTAADLNAQETDGADQDDDSTEVVNGEHE